MQNLYPYIPVVIIVSVLLYYLLREPWSGHYLILKACEHAVKRRIGQREVYPVDQLMNDCSISREFRKKASVLLGGINKLLESNDNKLRPDDVLKEVFMVSKTELEKSLYNNWEKAGLGSCVRVFSCDIINFLEENCSSNVIINKQWDEITQHPKNEDELIEFIESMSVCEMLNFFSPMIY